MKLTLLVDMVADTFEDRVVVGSRRGGITARELRTMSLRGAGFVQSQDATGVVFLESNGPAFPTALFAAARAGVPFVPVNYRLGDTQLTRVLGNHAGSVCIVEPRFRRIAEQAGLTAVTVDQWLSYVRDAAYDRHPPIDWDEEIAVVIYTSGTTSEPKAVLLRHANLMSYVLESVEFGSAGGHEAAMISVPPYHIAAVANVITNVYAGRRILALGQFEPDRWLELARDEAITNAMVVPTMLARIVEAPGDKRLPELRTLSYGGARMPRSIIEHALRLWPSVGFVNAYGLTETSSTIAVLGPEDHRAAMDSADPGVRARLGSVGQVLPSIEIEIRDPAGSPVVPGTSGRIWVRGGQVSAEYAGSGRAVDERGFFDTRDLGYMDTDGYLFVEGRGDDTIIRGGENISPEEIEVVLTGHPAVADAAVVGLADEQWGQRLEAVVVRRPGFDVDPDDLRAYVRDVLRSSKTPERITFWDELPRTETGKLIRRTVVTRLGEKATQTVRGR